MDPETPRRRGRPSAPSEHSLGAFLRGLRSKHRLTVRDLARAVGLPETSAGYISQLEQGAKVPSSEVAEQLAARLGDKRGIFRLWSLIGRRSDPQVAASARRELARLLDDPTLNDDARFIPEAWVRVVEAATVWPASPPSMERLWEVEASDSMPDPDVTTVASRFGASFIRAAIGTRQNPSALSIPLLDEGADPDRGALERSQHKSYVRLDPRAAVTVPLLHPFAYRLSAEGVRRVKPRLRVGDIAIFTRQLDPIVRHELYAVRMADRVVLSEVIWNRHQLLLLPGPDENDFVVLEVPEGRRISDLVLGHVATAIRGRPGWVE